MIVFYAITIYEMRGHTTKYIFPCIDVLALAGDNGGITYSTYFTIMGAAPGTTNTTAAASSAPAATANSTATATAGASGSGSNSTATATPTGTKSGANNLKAGLIGAAGVAGAVALLL